MANSSRDRYYTSPPSTASLGMGYGFSPTAVATPLSAGGNLVTGVWTPIQVDGSGFLQISQQFSSTATYGSVFTSITGSQTQIPAGALDWSITVQSGTAFVNGTPIFSANTAPLVGGPGAGRLNTPITVGTTGGRVLIVYDI